MDDFFVMVEAKRCSQTETSGRTAVQLVFGGSSEETCRAETRIKSNDTK